MSKRIGNIALWITVITFLSKLTGFVREVMLAAHYGTTIQSDAYIMSQSIVGVFNSIILAALGTTLIPVMSDYLHNKKLQQTNYFLNVVYTVILSIAIIIAILGAVFVKPLVSLFAPNFNQEAFELTVQLTSYMMPLIVITTLVTLNNAKLQNHNQFIIPAAIAIPQNFLVIFIMIFFTDAYGVQGLTIAFVAGAMLQVFMQYPFTRKLGYRYRIQFDFKEEGLKRIGLLIVPIMIGSSIQQINTLINRMLASGLPEGSVAALNFSNRLSVFILGILSAAIGSVYYTSMARYVSSQQYEAFKKLLKNTINLSIILIIPATVGLIVLRLPITQLIFERGVFDRSASEMTSIALLFYTIGLVGYLLRDVFNRALYALKDTRTATINGSIAVGLNIILSLVFVKHMGLGGLALAASIAGIVGSMLLLVSLYRKIGSFGLRNVMSTLLKTILASGVMAIIIHFSYNSLLNILHFNNTMSTLITILIGILVYAGFILVLKIEEVNIIKEMLFRRIKKKGT